MGISFLPGSVPASEVGVNCHFVFSEVPLWLLGAALPSQVHLNPLHLHSKPSRSGQKLFVTECDLSATCHHQLTPLERGFPLKRHKNALWSFPIPSGWEKNLGFGLDLVVLRRCQWLLLEDPCLVIYPWFLSLHGAFPIMDPAGKWGGGQGLQGQEVASVPSLQTEGAGKVRNRPLKSMSWTSRLSTESQNLLSGKRLTFDDFGSSKSKDAGAPH